MIFVSMEDLQLVFKPSHTSIGFAEFSLKLTLISLQQLLVFKVFDELVWFLLQAKHQSL